jgi:hypothetical protein
MFSFSLLIDPPSVVMLVGQPSASEVIGRASLRPSAGVPVLAVSRFMGTSIAMIDRHYGLANDSREHAVALLDALALKRAVDAAWTSTHTPRKPVRKTVAGSQTHRPRCRVDARWTPRPVFVASLGDERS